MKKESTSRTLCMSLQKERSSMGLCHFAVPIRCDSLQVVHCMIKSKSMWAILM